MRLLNVLTLSMALGLLSACAQVDEMARDQVASQLTQVCQSSIEANEVWQRPEVSLFGGNKVKEQLQSNCGCVGKETTAAFETSELFTILLKQGQLNDEQKVKMSNVMIRCQTSDLPPFVQKLFQNVMVIE